MKKLLVLLLLVTLPLAAFAGRPAKRINNARLSALIAECRQYDGAEVITIGGFGTSLIKGAVRLSAGNDPEARAALRLFSGVRSFGALEFSDCSEAARERISEKIERLLARSEMLVEVKEDDTHMCVYGLLDDASATVRDIVLYDAEDCVFVYAKGSVSMEVVGELMATYD
jgi:hypothetical protein